MINKKIYILTAVHNDLEDTKKLIESIFTQTFKNFKLFLIDDGSIDGTSSFIRKKYPQVNIIKGNGNLWWTASLNLGLKDILKVANKNDYVWIINNDCYFNKDVLQNLLTFGKGIVGDKNITGSVIINSNTKKVVDAGVAIDWKKLKFKSGGTDAISTKGTLYPIKVFNEIDLFDAKHFPHYFSDYEFAIRAKRNGYKLHVCRASKIYNRVKRTGIEGISKKSTLLEKFNLLFSRKSKLNLITQIKIIRYVSPPKYRFGSYLLLLSKLVNGKK